jgi:hypothetical protein
MTGAFRWAVAAGMVLAIPAGAEAQKDWYNLDRGHPFVVTDARSLERNVLEFQLTPFEASREQGGAYQWTIVPSAAAGLLPRTELEVALPVHFHDGGGVARTGGLARVELGVLHALNLESASLPGLAVETELLLPVGSEAPEALFATVGALATRNLGRRLAGTRVHFNVSGTLGDREQATDEVDRWRAGLALDRAWPLEATLVGAELAASEPALGGSTEWMAGAGVRRQVSPRVTADAGLRWWFAGEATGWGVVLGFSWAGGLARDGGR